jgi:hypothetical protein
MEDPDDLICVSTHVERRFAELTVRVLREHEIAAAAVPTDDGLCDDDGELVWMVTTRPADRDRAREIEAATLGRRIIEQPDGSVAFAE